MHEPALEITAIPAFSDNYIWLLTAGGTACAVVDPGDHRPVLEYVRERGLELRYILLTHHHSDHTGGVPGLLAEFPATVIGPDDRRIGNITQIVRQGDRVTLPELGVQFDVLEVPGHTSSHIAYFGAEALFCGDTLFSIGCGRLFEGTPAQMQESLDKLAALPPGTRVYCAHEYTQSNCAFALAVEPGNAALREIAARVSEARAAGRGTLPAACRPNSRPIPSCARGATAWSPPPGNTTPGPRPGVSTMAVIRAWKDRFAG